MTATILLIRHAAHDQLGRVLSGRTPGLSLTAQGLSQAERVTARLASGPIDLVQASPVQRAQQTAHAIADARGLAVDTAEALNELDFGDWAGRAFVELEGDPRWQTWNSQRAVAVAPNGESMAQAQERAWRHVERTALAHEGSTVAMVTHCDVIRALIAHVLGLSLDHIHRFDVGPASISRIVAGSWGAKLLTLNEECL